MHPLSFKFEFQLYMKENIMAKAQHFEDEYLPNQMLDHYIEHVPSLLVVGMGTSQVWSALLL